VQNYGKKDTLQRILFFFCAEAAYFRNFLEYYCFSLPYLKIKSVPLRREMRKHSFHLFSQFFGILLFFLTLFKNKKCTFAP